MKRIGVTPSQIVSGLASGAGVALAFLKTQTGVAIPTWVYWVMAGLVLVAASCRSIWPANNGGVSDVKAAAVHSAGSAS